MVKTIQQIALEKYPVKMEQYTSGIPNGMFGMCDSNHYVRQAFIAGYQFHLELSGDVSVPPEDWDTCELFDYLVEHDLLPEDADFEEHKHDRTDMLASVQQHLDL